MDKTKIIAIIAFSLLVVIIIFLLVWNTFLLKESFANKVIIDKQEDSKKSVVFAHLFIDKILLSSGTVGFDDRLELENSVRAIGDEEIFSEWQKFTSIKEDTDAQKTVGKLLKLLIDKICPK